MTDRHPLARFEQAHRILPHTLVEVCDLLGADAFSFDEPQVRFRRRSVGSTPTATWYAQIGDWLVRDPRAGWMVVPDVVDFAALGQTSPAPISH